MKMREYLGITEDSVYYYRNQSDKMKRDTRAKIRQDYAVYLKKGTPKNDIIKILCSKWLCSESVVYCAIKEDD